MLINGIIELQDTNIRKQAKELTNCAGDLQDLIKSMNNMDETTWKGAGADAFLNKKRDLIDLIMQEAISILRTANVIYRTLETYEQAEESAKQTIFTFGG